MEAVEQLVGRVPELAASPELDRSDGHVHGVDEVRCEEGPERGHATAEAHVLTVGCGPGLTQRFGRLPHQPCESRSSHGPFWGPNLPRPMISAPMLLVKSRVK